MALSANSSNGTQQTTQSPQTSSAASGFGGGQDTNAVQPGVAGSQLLTSTGGIPLSNTPVSTVNLAATTTATATQTKVITPTKHHINGTLFGFSALLLVVAVALFWATARSVNKTTKYV